MILSLLVTTIVTLSCEIGALAFQSMLVICCGGPFFSSSFRPPYAEHRSGYDSACGPVLWGRSSFDLSLFSSWNLFNFLYRVAREMPSSSAAFFVSPSQIRTASDILTLAE